jgi:aconitate hydratase
MMGVLPLQFAPGTTRATLALDGSETFDIPDLAAQVAPGSTVRLQIRRDSGTVESVDLQCRIDTANELQVWSSGGMMPFVLRRLAQGGSARGISGQKSPGQQDAGPVGSRQSTSGRPTASDR